jgi:hypothetical protein
MPSSPAWNDQAPFVRQYLDQEGIEEATPEGARHRCPFLSGRIASDDGIMLPVARGAVSRETSDSRCRREADADQPSVGLASPRRCRARTPSTSIAATARRRRSG